MTEIDLGRPVATALGWTWVMAVGRVPVVLMRGQAEELHRRLGLALGRSRAADPALIEAAEAEVRQGVAVSEVVKRYGLSGSVAQRLRQMRRGL